MIAAVGWFLFGCVIYLIGWLNGARWLNRHEDNQGAWLPPDRRKWRP